jgi:purine nucleoside permease
MKALRRILVPLALAVVSCCAPQKVAAETPTPVKVVIVSMFEIGEVTGDAPGEFQFWVEREGLDRVWPFPHGFRDLRSNADGSVLGVVTGIGTARAAATIMALGLDPRFDFRSTYWLVAGIAGVDPADASLASAAWAEWIVDGDLAHEIDAREIPDDWPTGYLPLRRKRPYEPPAKSDEGESFRLDSALVDWAYQLTKDTDLGDTPGIKAKRDAYVGFPNAQRPPFVLKGDNLAAMTYWHGKYMNQWANEWVAYHTEGRGNYVTTAMEDTGTLQSLTWLDNAGKVDASRVLVLRTASNFDMQWPGATAVESLTGEKLAAYSAFIPSLESAHKVGSRVLHALIDGWETYEHTLPGTRD